MSNPESHSGGWLVLVVEWKVVTQVHLTLSLTLIVTTGGLKPSPPMLTFVKAARLLKAPERSAMARAMSAKRTPLKFLCIGCVVMSFQPHAGRSVESSSVPASAGRSSIFDRRRVHRAKAMATRPRASAAGGRDNGDDAADRPDLNPGEAKVLILGLVFSRRSGFSNRNERGRYL